tara:strand:- start:28 stop:354 length:327 start_codon:yes stop_codon:yes gene_type:complete
MIKMSWKNELKKDDNRNFADSNDRDWMEDANENSHNPERRREGDVQYLAEKLMEEIDDRLARDDEDQDYVTYKPINKQKVYKQLLPIIEDIIKNHIEYDMSKFVYSGP